jgi:UDP-N-acetylglucosamine diphosphorylase / glucose-1-phosphate thymidylyltransferase / UDP-N-acetylgalactosamine diphosphorylase / glucosamine-1-phosphate N-acetyltransferase / galactosamine-1-phosphate N-acetyltransferase
MQAVIMAAGEGTRMRPLTYKTPKPMLLVKGKPILEWTISFLPAEVDEVIIIVNYLADQIKNYFGEEWKGRKIKYVVQKELNGTGGAIHACKDLIWDKFLVLNGDDIYHRDDLKIMCGENLAVLGFEVDDPSKYGVLVTNKEGDLVDSIEKPQNMLGKAVISTNAFCLNKKFFDYDLVQITEKEYGLPQTLAVMAKDYPVKVLKTMRWFPVGNPEDLAKAQTEIEKFIVE